MQYGLSWKGERCPDGVEAYDHIEPIYDDTKGGGLFGLAEERKIVGEKTTRRFRFASEERVPVALELRDLKNPVVEEFARSTTEEALETFLSKYGLLNASRRAKVSSENAEFVSNMRWFIERSLLGVSPDS